jgi:dynein regulatory complex protein 1
MCFHLVGCRLESDIAVLEQHLETMRATYQLNAEKLEYNYRVLLERDAGERCSAHGTLLVMYNSRNVLGVCEV